MKLVAEYRQFAEQYRKLSEKLASPTDRQAVELMASAWDKLATERQNRVLHKVVRKLFDRICQEQVHG
jgi:hypothetical protein